MAVVREGAGRSGRSPAAIGVEGERPGGEGVGGAEREKGGDWCGRGGASPP